MLQIYLKYKDLVLWLLKKTLSSREEPDITMTSKAHLHQTSNKGGGIWVQPRVHDDIIFSIKKNDVM